jgi:hypothetical protein
VTACAAVTLRAAESAPERRAGVAGSIDDGDGGATGGVSHAEWPCYATVSELPDPIASAEPSVFADSDATPGATTLSRVETAKAIQVDESTVRRMAKDGRLTPVRGPGGVTRFRAEQVREVTIQRSVSSSVSVSDTSEGEIAATLFELFDDGVGPADAVKRLRLPPRTVSAIFHEWAELRGGMFVPEGQLREMVARFGLSTPVRGPAHLVEQLKRVWPTGVCTECGIDSPTLCVACLATLKERAVKRMAVEREIKMREREIETGMQFTPEGHLARGNAWRARRSASGDTGGGGQAPAK